MQFHQFFQAFLNTTTIRKHSNQKITSDKHVYQVDSCETMLTELHKETPNELLDNVLYYISGFIVRSLLPKLKSKECRYELLLDAGDPHSFTALEYTKHTKLTCFKQRSGLLFSLTAVLKIMKAAEVIFKKRVLWKEKKTLEENIYLKIQYSVFKQPGPGV